MNNIIISTACLEFRRLYKHWLFYLGIALIIGIPLILDSPLHDGHLWIASSSAYAYMHGACTVGVFYIPLLISSLYDSEEYIEVTKIIFSQPIKSYQYALGKYLGGLITFFLIVLIGVVVNLFIPIYFGHIPYSPVKFFESLFIYLIPSVIFYSALSHLVAILAKSSLLTMIIPVVIMFITERLPEIFRFRLGGNNLATLSFGKKLPSNLISFLVINRLFFLVIGFIFLLLSIAIYSPLKYIERR